MSWQPDKGDNLDRCPVCGEPTTMVYEPNNTPAGYRVRCPHDHEAARAFYPDGPPFRATPRLRKKA